jgi:hypothetical protein
MKPIGLPPALNRAALTKERTPAAIGADNEVPAAPISPPPAYMMKSAPAAAMSG